MVDGTHFVMSACTEKHAPMPSAGLNYFAQEQENFHLTCCINLLWKLFKFRIQQTICSLVFLYQKSYVFKTPGHAADLLSFGVMNSSWTANLAGLFARAQYVLQRCCEKGRAHSK